MKKLKEISVIIPIFNLEMYIENCIKSIQNETIPLEILLSDDGSWDCSAQIVDWFAAENESILVVHKPNQGVTIARLTGVQLAQGENIGFCDGDDEIEPEMYERLLNNKIKYNADITHCGHKVVYVDGREEYFYNTGRLAKQDREEGLKDLLSGSFEPGLCSKLYSKTLLHSLLHSGKMDYSIKNNEDLLMNYYLFKFANTTVFEDFCPYHYMKREESASQAKLNEHTIFDPIKVKKIIFEDCKNKNEEKTAHKALMMTYFHTLNSVLGSDSNSFLCEANLIRDEMKKHICEVRILGYKYSILYLMSVFAPHTYKMIYNMFG